MKRYFENWKKIYPFSEYGDYENYFIELAYATTKQEFKSCVGNPLTNKTALNGKSIFKNVNIDFQKYSLLAERIEEQTGDLLFVFVTYGFAPSKNYTTYTAEPVQIFGLEDPSGYLQISVNTSVVSTYNVPDDEFKIQISDTQGLNVGDFIRMKFIGKDAFGIHFYNGVSPSVPIVEVGGGYVITPAFEMTFVDKKGVVQNTQSKIATINVISGIDNWDGQRNFIREASTRQPKTIITSVFNDISYYTSFPQLDARFVVSNGDAESDIITANTTPNVSTWKSMIANGERIVIQDASVDVVYPNTLFKKTVKRALAR